MGVAVRDGGDSVGSWGDSDSGVVGTTTAGRVATAGWVASVSTGIVAAVTAGVSLLNLVVLSDLDGLLDVVEFNTNDPLIGDAVHGGRGTVLRWNMAVAMSVTAGSLVLDLLRQENVLDFVEKMRVYVVALAFGITDGHGLVVSAAAEAAQRDRWRVGWWGGVAVAHGRLGDGATQEGEGDLLTNINKLRYQISKFS